MAVRRQAPYKADDIWDTPDDGNRYEVIDGQMFVTPPPLEVHQRGAGGLNFLLVQYVRPRGLGRVYFAPIGVVLDDENGLQPDLVYVSLAREGIIVERGIEGAPDLVVEVLSPSTRSRDLGIKLRRYAAAGVQHYWLLDPRTRALRAFELVGNAYELVAEHAPGETFRPSLFPGLEIPIDDVWA